MGRKLAAAGIGLLVVLGFVAFVATGAVRGKLVSKGFFEEQLREQKVYDRLFDDLVEDPAFKPQLESLFGGIDVAPEDVKDQIKNIVKPEYIQDLVESGIDSFITYFRGGPLTIDLEITKIVEGIYQTMIDYTMKEIDERPVKEMGSLDEFAQELMTLVQRMVTEGAIPAYIPRYSIPPEHRAEVADALGQAGKLDINNPQHEDAILALVQAIQEDDIVKAIKVSAAAMMYQLITASVLEITNNEVVRQVQDGETLRFVMSPPASVQTKLAGKLEIVQTASGAAGWARIAGLAVVILGAGGIFFLLRDDKRAALRWIGAPILIGGAIGLVAWTIGKGMVSTKVDGVVGKTGLPESLKAIMTDVSGGVVSGISPAFMIPSIVALAIGAALIGGSFAMKK